MRRIEKLAPPLSVMYRSPDPQRIYTYSPGICTLESGRMIGTMDFGGPGVLEMEGHVVGKSGNGVLGKIFVSDDRGKSWQFKSNFGFLHARPFEAGGVIYVLGHNEDLMIMKSEDMGETWSEPVRFTEGQHWHQAPSNVCYANGNVYLVMERKPYLDCKGWDVSVMAPVLMRGNVNSDLTDVKNWTFASEAVFRDLIDQNAIHYFGVPFFPSAEKEPVILCEKPVLRSISPIGWLETNVVQFKDPSHIWCDPTGHTFHLWMRAHTGGTGYACILKVVEKEDGTMETVMEKSPSGKETVFVPCPGGQMKFHILYDEVSRLYWLLSTQATDSMVRPEMMPKERFATPNNERQRLVLHFSKNCIDWCFAGLVDEAETYNGSRHYASMTINGDDLFVLSRSGDENALSAHNGNMITCHRIENFRELIY